MAVKSVDSSTASPTILVILGPTASGKSDLAFQLARRTGAEILSVDSMQIYRGMDIGTAKASASERAEVRHHAIDLVDPNEPFTVARFVGLADEVIRDAAVRQVPLIATGGTPLYYKALFDGLFEGPSADEAVRERLRALSNEDLHRRVIEVDPVAGARIHLQDSRRLIRALEVHELTGRPITSFQTDWASKQSRHPAKWVGLSWDRDVLNRRINARVKGMMTAGWLEETRALLEKYNSFSTTAGEATGYHELAQHLAGKLSWDDAIEQIKMATRQLARRQMKWFRRFPEVHPLPGDSSIDDNVERALSIWNLLRQNQKAPHPNPSPGAPGGGDPSVPGAC